MLSSSFICIADFGVSISYLCYMHALDFQKPFMLSLFTNFLKFWSFLPSMTISACIIHKHQSILMNLSFSLYTLVLTKKDSFTLVFALALRQSCVYPIRMHGLVVSLPLKYNNLRLSQAKKETLLILNTVFSIYLFFLIPFLVFFINQDDKHALN